MDILIIELNVLRKADEKETDDDDDMRDDRVEEGFVNNDKFRRICINSRGNPSYFKTTISV